ncbi:MAG: hypothetical protein EZS28_002699 [Streblomastix strix]|uniref:Uncharacterized protein n=1 Tax=Streblomastix strix TaxID=222440 RepID=A0A5J4X392_9EUKA|nr:MAG: hypothetical protein EZS28_002699 [Streblomastix strix]
MFTETPYKNIWTQHVDTTAPVKFVIQPILRSTPIRHVEHEPSFESQSLFSPFLPRSTLTQAVQSEKKRKRLISDTLRRNPDKYSNVNISMIDKDDYHNSQIG